MTHELLKPGTSECRLFDRQQGPDRNGGWPNLSRLENTDTSGCSCLPFVYNQLVGLHDLRRSKLPVGIGFFRGPTRMETPEEGLMGIGPQAPFSSRGPSQPHAPGGNSQGHVPPSGRNDQVAVVGTRRSPQARETRFSWRWQAGTPPPSPAAPKAMASRIGLKRRPPARAAAAGLRPPSEIGDGAVARLESQEGEDGTGVPRQRTNGESTRVSAPLRINLVLPVASSCSCGLA